MQNTGNSIFYGLRYLYLLCYCFPVPFDAYESNIIVVYISTVVSLILLSFLQYDSVCIQAVNLDLTHPKRVYFENVSLYT